MNFIYVVCFVAALRCVPWFPRLLVAAWSLDITSQLAMAQIVGGISGLPHGVGEQFATLLGANIQKVMISMTIWMPYLILSERVNLTYRNRLARESAV
jgi:hypothetical protein